MPLFTYKSRNAEGAVVSGTIEASDEMQAADTLSDQGLLILSLSEKRKPIIFSATLPFLHRVPAKELVVFSRQLAVMIGSDIPIVRALRILSKQTNRSYFKIVLSEIAAEVDGGAKLSSTLARYPHIFDGFFVHLVRSGETTGRLDEVLEYLASQKEREYQFLSQVRGSMIYPVFIIVGMISVAIIMMVFVIPKLTSILLEAGAVLPLTTRILIAVSSFLQHQWWILVLLALAGILLWVLARRTEAGRIKLDQLKLRIPVIGKIYEKVSLMRFSQSMASLMASGVPITQALEIAGDIVNNAVYRNLIRKAMTDIETGKQLSQALSHDKYIPVMLRQMINVGEETGRLDRLMKNVGDFYDREVQSSVQNLVRLVEPLVIVALGIGVGLMVTGILLPMYNLSSTIT